MNYEEIKKKISKLYADSNKMESINEYLFSNIHGIKCFLYKIVFSVYILLAVIFVFGVVYVQNIMAIICFSIIYFTLTILTRYINIRFFEKQLVEKKYGINKNEKNLSLSVFKYKIIEKPEIYNNITGIIDLVEMDYKEIEITFFRRFFSLFTIIVLPFIIGKYQNEIIKKNEYIYIIILIVFLISIVIEFFDGIINMKKNRKTNILKYLKIIKFEKDFKA